VNPSQQMVYEPKSPAPAPLAAATGETAGMVLAAQAKALVEARFTIALKKPRDIDVVREKLLRECARPSFAEVAIYHKPVGEGIEGPSIRFAEAAIQAMGNLAIDTPTIYDDGEKRIMRVTVSDMETNVTHSKDVTIMKRVERNRLGDGQVPLRQRVNSRGRVVYLVEATDDEILNAENALVSKALRTTGLRLVPGWLIDECMRKVREVREAGGQDPDAQRRKLFDAFASVNISADKVKEWLGHDGSALTAKERSELFGIYTALKDGDTTWREVMDEREAKAEKPADPAAAPTAEPPKKGAAAVKAAIKPTAPAPAAPPPPAAAAAPAEPRAAEEAPAAGERKAPETGAARQVREVPVQQTFRPAAGRRGDEPNFD
jgi:hypothetical protein